jgi:hypothetical protein
LEEIIKDAAMARGIRFRCQCRADTGEETEDTGAVGKERPIPGSPAVWTTIGREVALNIVRHRPPGDRAGESPELIMRYKDHDEPGYPPPGTLILSGASSFFDSLREDVRRGIGTTAELIAKAHLTTEKWERLGEVTQASSGAGLFFLTRICELAGMKAMAIISDPNDEFLFPGSKSFNSALETVSFERVKTFPLSLVISWP